jgi:hypothetical protein
VISIKLLVTDLKSYKFIAWLGGKNNGVAKIKAPVFSTAENRGFVACCNGMTAL